MLAIIDYGVGNLFSLQSSLHKVGVRAMVTGSAAEICEADHIILPGVGAFGDAADKLRVKGLDKVVCERAARGIPLLGICLGMQLLFETGYEYGEHKGLGLIPGKVVPMQGRLPEKLDIPHIGWNELHFQNGKNELFRYIEENDHVYFVHSFFADECAPYQIATTEYGEEITAAVARGQIYGCQFHPEKSGSIGLKILKAFCETGDTI